MKANIHKLYAPQCALDGCNTLVNYHNKVQKGDGSWSYKWKTFCDHHRTVGKAAVETFKKAADGCENKDGIYGFVCTSPDVDSSILEIDHFDGDRYNNEEENLKRVCPNCHRKKTKESGEFQNRYVTMNTHFDTLFSVDNNDERL